MMTCIAVDDEDLALDYISDNIRQVPFLRLVGRCKNSFEANELLKNKKIDLIYLDIQMPGISGLQFIQSLTTPPMIILTTAYEKYALEGYNFDVVDYLLKPIEFERFLKASNKAFELFSLKNNQPQEKSDDDTLFVHADYSLLMLKANEIIYIEGLKDYVKIYTVTRKHPILVRLSLKSLEDRLAKNNFIRVHKSFLVNSEKITFIRSGKISIGEALIPIGEFYKDQLDRFVDPKSLQ